MTLPAVVVGLIQRGFSVSRLVGGLVWILLISLIILGLSCLLGWVVARISQKLKSKSFLIALLSLTFLILYYVVYFRLMKHLPELIQSMLLYGESVRSSANPLYLFGQVGVGDWLAMLVCTAAVCLVLALIWMLLKRSFLSVATSSAAGKKAVYREEAARQGSASTALLRKEWLRFSSSATYMLNCGLGLLVQLALGVYLLLKGGSLFQSIGAVLPFLSSDAGMLPVLVCAICCLSYSILDITAPSVSLEGRSVWLPQSLPVTPWQVLRAKLGLHLGLAILPTLFCLITAAVLVPATLAQKLLLVVTGLLFMLLIALVGLHGRALGLVQHREGGGLQSRQIRSQVPEGPVCHPGAAGDMAAHGNAALRQRRLEDGSGGHQRRRQPPGKVAAAPGVGKALVFDQPRVVRVTGPGRIRQVYIISAPGLPVGDQDAQGRAGSPALPDAADDAEGIGLHPCSENFTPRSA